MNHPQAPHVSWREMSHPPRGCGSKTRVKNPINLTQRHWKTSVFPPLLPACSGLLRSFPEEPCLLPSAGSGLESLIQGGIVEIFHARAICLVREMRLTWCLGSAAPYLLMRHISRAHGCHQPRCAEPCAPGTAAGGIPVDSLFFAGSRSRAGAGGAKVGADK